MNNEEKNLSPEENQGETNNAPKAENAKKKLSPALIGGIAAGAVLIILAIVLIFTLGPKDPEQPGEDNGETQPAEKITHTVTVLDDEGNPIKGAMVSFNITGGMSVPFPTDIEGKVSYKTDKDLTVSVTKIPEGYEYDMLDRPQRTDENGNLSVVISKLPPLIVRVVDQDGNPVAGVTVQMCSDDGICKSPMVTGEDGTAKYAYDDGVFHALLTGGSDALPEGYSIANPDIQVDLVDGVATIVVVKNVE